MAVLPGGLRPSPAEQDSSEINCLGVAHHHSELHKLSGTSTSDLSLRMRPLTKLVMSVVAPLIIVQEPWITTQGFVLGMEVSLRSRLFNLSNGRSDAESLYWGIRWEGLRSQWFNRFGRRSEANKVLARLSYLEQKYADEVKQDHS